MAIVKKGVQHISNWLYLNVIHFIHFALCTPTLELKAGYGYGEETTLRSWEPRRWHALLGGSVSSQDGSTGDSCSAVPTCSCGLTVCRGDREHRYRHGRTRAGSGATDLRRRCP